LLRFVFFSLTHASEGSRVVGEFGVARLEIAAARRYNSGPVNTASRTTVRARLAAGDGEKGAFMGVGNRWYAWLVAVAAAAAAPVGMFAQDVKKDEPAKVEPKKDEPKVETKDAPKVEVKKEEPKKEEPKKEDEEAKKKLEKEAKAAEAHNEVRVAFRELLNDVKTLSDFQDRWKEKGPAFREKAKKLLTEHPDFEEGATSMLALAGFFAKLQQPEQVALAKELLEQIKKNLPKKEVGQKAADALADMDEVGKSFEAGKREFPLSFIPLGATKKWDIREARGKVVVVYFWATWCAPCQAATNEIKEVYKKYRDKGLEVVGISLDEDRDRLTDYIRKNEIPWAQQFDGRLWENEIARKWAINSVPTVFLVDKLGKLVSRDARGGLEEQLPALLDAKVEPAKDEPKKDEPKKDPKN